MKEEAEASHFFGTVLAAGVEAVGGRDGQRGAMWPGCWQLKHVTTRSG